MGNVIDYRAPDIVGEGRSTPFYTFFLYWICTAIVLAAVTAMSLAFTLRFEKIFRDFKMDLPEITKMVILFGRLPVLISLWVLSPLPGVIAMAIRAGQVGDYPPRRPWRAVGVTFMLVVVVALVFGIAVFAPMISLIETVSGPKR